MSRISNKLYVAPLLAAAVFLAAGCAPSYNDRPYNSGVYEQPVQNDGYRGDSRSCNQCGVVQSVQRVAMSGGDSGHGTLGAVIGAVAGGVLGSAVGKGDGRKAATVVGAVAGGVAGNQVGKRSGGDDAYRIVLNMDNGQQAVITQREDPQLRRGDYAQVRGQRVYAR